MRCFVVLFALMFLIPVHVTATDMFRLGPGDVVRVTVFGEENLSGTFSLDSDGRLAMPLLGPVMLGGLSLKEAEETLVSCLADGWLRQPNVALEVTTHRPFYILGEVQKPGAYPWASGLSVMGAVALGGGFTYRADEDDISIRRDDAKIRRVSLTVPVQPGDIIHVHQRFF
ncbi:polysaccharide export protein [Haematospirillum sp. 15-248]|uniref:polysaccharide biosynthesis/export family protein n=2 Tax=Haematospirillum TaxID=1804663 RepID=UPI00143A27EB|nr:polysaccharide biosynthesis/export family protein [Haematospirillum sp. 15-248]NKD55471.1 polysaccharide export protein [Haematospirillum sp. H4890]NKD75611.1 polysaccharide export protein [Haematospirillum sp. H4485]NKD86721.1 polysaccharide export protein [Haematospirillum sp. 15-248]